MFSNNRSRIEDIKFVLEKLKELEIHPSYLEYDEYDECSDVPCHFAPPIKDHIMKSNKSHLFQLLPLLSEFITSKENDLKIIIKEILRMISIEMGVI